MQSKVLNRWKSERPVLLRQRQSKVSPQPGLCGIHCLRIRGGGFWQQCTQTSEEGMHKRKENLSDEPETSRNLAFRDGTVNTVGGWKSCPAGVLKQDPWREFGKLCPMYHSHKYKEVGFGKAAPLKDRAERQHRQLPSRIKCVIVCVCVSECVRVRVCTRCEE